MNIILMKINSFSVVLCSLFVGCVSSHAALIVQIRDVEGGVEMEYSGSVDHLNVYDLGSFFTNTDNDVLVHAGYIQTTTDVTVNQYVGIEANNPIWDEMSDSFPAYNNGLTLESNVEVFGFIFFDADIEAAQDLNIPTDYGIVIVLDENIELGDPMSGVSFFEGASVRDLQLLEGEYRYDWGEGEQSDYMEISIIASDPIPEPSSTVMIGLFSLVSCLRRRR